MTLFPASPFLRIMKVLLLATLLVPAGFAAGAAHERERGSTSFRGVNIPLWEKHRHERPGWRERRHDARADRHRRPRDRRAGHFHGGAISAWRDRGNGTYFYFDTGAGMPPVARGQAAAGGRVIRVLPGNDGCSWEGGVCVVRP